MERRHLLISTAAISTAGLTGVPKPAQAGSVVYNGPPIAVARFEPIHNGKLIYARTAPPVAGAAPGIKLFLRLWIQNQGTSPVNLTGIVLRFPGTNVPDREMWAVQWVLGGPGLWPSATIPNGQTRQWANTYYEIHPGPVGGDNLVYLDGVPPPTVQVRISAEGYSEPYVVTYELTFWPVANTFPFAVTDLAQDEYIEARGAHANGGFDGGQVYAHDIGVLGWDGTGWSPFLPGLDHSANANYRVWDLKVRAAAAGVVEACGDGTVPDNPNPGVVLPGVLGAGNWVWLRHPDNTLTIYLHLRQHTLMVTQGQTVVAGQELGRVGNSGSSSAPHLHLEIIGNYPPLPQRPWGLRDNWVVEQAPTDPPWVIADRAVRTLDHSLPPRNMLVWPSIHPPDGMHVHIPQLIVPEFPPHWSWPILQRAAENDFLPASLDVREFADTGLLSMVLNRAQGLPWQAEQHLTGSALTTRLAVLRASGYRPALISAYTAWGATFYSLIVHGGPSPSGESYHGVDLGEHERRAGEMAVAGLRPISISVIAPGGQPRVTACYRAGSVGTVATAVQLTPSALDIAVRDNKNAGRHLVHLGSSPQTGGVRFSAVFYQQVPGGGTTTFQRGLTEPELRREHRRRLRMGQQARALTSYMDSGAVRFAVAWR